jgi:hypothetical protein
VVYRCPTDTNLLETVRRRATRVPFETLARVELCVCFGFQFELYVRENSPEAVANEYRYVSDDTHRLGREPSARLVGAASERSRAVYGN